MRAPGDSHSEQCNNIQYLPHDGGLYPEWLTVLSYIFQNRGPSGN